VTEQVSPDKWDRVLTFQQSKVSLAILAVTFVVVVAFHNSAWTIPIKILVLAVAFAYWLAVAVKSVRAFRAGYKPDA
jgi:hypothetical protein